MSRRSGISSKRTTLGESDVHSDEDDTSDDHSSAAYDDNGSDLDSTDDTSLPESSFSPSTRPSFLPILTRLKKSSKPFLDLSRQRNLLIDSQKLNQTLKRCLGRTEEMIADAKKALEFTVRIDELEPLRGRVLTPDDEGVVDWVRQGNGLLSPSIDGVVDNPWEVGQDDGSKVEGDESGGGKMEGQGDESEAHDSEAQESEDLESVGMASPSPHEETGGKGLGRYLGSLGESLGL